MAIDQNELDRLVREAAEAVQHAEFELVRASLARLTVEALTYSPHARLISFAPRCHCDPSMTPDRLHNVDGDVIADAHTRWCSPTSVDFRPGLEHPIFSSDRGTNLMEIGDLLAALPDFFGPSDPQEVMLLAEQSHRWVSPTQGEALKLIARVAPQLLTRGSSWIGHNIGHWLPNSHWRPSESWDVEPTDASPKAPYIVVVDPRTTTPTDPELSQDARDAVRQAAAMVAKSFAKDWDKAKTLIDWD
ncbi:MAG: hypothetical protein LBG60_04960 [Bifidobacteriaceae bacterium]|jgi:hypothetical protein|nr:hypothetical protein [Bifidobacteriaceae bacterium]